MKTTILTVGRIKDPFAGADAHYRKLLERYQPVEVIEARDDAAFLKRLRSIAGSPASRPGARVIALDRSGGALDSLAWSRWLEERRLEARDLCFLVGGPRGLPREALRGAETVSLGPQTLAHQLARIVLLEQLFRAAKIAAGEPYHY